VLLAGCATYHRAPLPAAPNLAREAPGGVAPLDMERVATVAVLNSPTLQVARASYGVAQAQAFAAGLLPDPHFQFTADHPYDRVAAGDPRYPEYNTYGLELDIDLLSLLTHSNVRAAARGDLRNAQLQLLWQEWQTVAEARTLYVEHSSARERRDFLAQAQQIYADAAQHSQRAQAAGNATLEQTSADLAVLQDVGTRLGDAERSLLTAQQGLHALLGVDPSVPLPLQPLPPPRLPSRAEIESAVALLAQRRPDLLALRAGYGAEEERVRIAIWSQFPNVVIGFTKARDNSNVHSAGGLVNLNLPLFNRGRGQIAIERATREQLRADYQARLDQASSDVWHLWNELQQLQAQLLSLEQQQPLLQRSVDAAARAYRASEFPAASYLTLVGSYLAAQELHATLLQNLWSDSIALSTVLGTQVQPGAQSPLPPATPPMARAQPAPPR
jgi:outer membrane protein TolC